MKNTSYALITGASSGIGKAIAYELAKRKINVILIALPNSGLKEVREDIVIRFDIKTDLLELDLTIPESHQVVFQWCQSRSYDIGILVNNAGIGNLCAFENTDASFITRMLMLNNQAMVALVHLFAAQLKRRGAAYILNVGSLGSFFPLPYKSVYAATKGFVHAFSRALRLEWKQYNVHVSCLCPGSTMTSKEVVERAKTLPTNYLNLHQTAESVAREAVTALFQKKKTIVPGWSNKVLYHLAFVLPSFVIDWFLLRIFSRNQFRDSLPKALQYKLTKTDTNNISLTEDIPLI
jgi:short-subunit dehydrogenase